MNDIIDTGKNNEKDETFKITEEWPTWNMIRKLSVVGFVFLFTLFTSFFLSHVILL